MAAQEGQAPAQGGEQALNQMIIQTDQALSKLAQVLAQANPQLGQALGQLGEQFRQVISAAMGGGAQQQEAQPKQRQMGPQMAPMETGGKDAQPAY